MKRPDNLDIWDGMDVKVDNSLTEDQKEELVQNVTKHVKKLANQILNGQDILNIMEISEGKYVTIIDINENKIDGFVELYESRYDNQDDDIAEASICVVTMENESCLLYESDIKSIKILEY